MRRCKRLLLLLLSALLMASCLVVPMSAADTGDEGARHTRKVVSVMYDNSGSMLNNGSKMRHVYAKYSIQMLMALLSEEDTLIITPLNRREGTSGVALHSAVPVDSAAYSEEVDLSKKDRDAEIKRFLEESFLKLDPRGNTPHTPIQYAVEQLVNNGLKSRDQLTNDEDDTEYWLVFLSDGDFNSASVSDAVESNIKDYPSLKTIFIGFGEDAPKRESVVPLMQKYPFTYYGASVEGEAVVEGAQDITTVIQSVANQLSGRLPLDSGKITKSGNTVKVNLDACEYTIKSVSAIAQNCGAMLKSAKYKGSPIDIQLPCEISPAGTPLKAGYTAVMEGDPYLYGGVLELEFSAPVDQIAIMVEPALSIETYLEYQENGTWTRADMQKINSEMSGGDKIRAGFEVFEQATGKQIDLKSLFGETVSSVTYAGKRYDIGEAFPLVVGNNEIVVEVSVMDGAYSMYSSTICIIEANPEDYRVESKITDNSKPGSMKTEIEYTVYLDNKPADKAALKNYTYRAELISPSGTSKELKCTMGSDGKIKTEAALSSGEFGVYDVVFTVTSEYRISRSRTDKTNLYPEELKVLVKGLEELSLSQYGITNNNTPFSFELKSGGKAFDFENGVTEYTVTLDGVDVTGHTTVEGNMLTYVPRAEHFGAGVSLGTKTVKVDVVCPSYPALSASAETKINVLSTAFTIEPVDAGNREVDRFDIDGSDAVLYFRVLRDGVPLPKADLEAAFPSVEFSDPAVLGWMYWLPGGSEASVEEINGEAVLSYRVVNNWKKLSVGFMAMFIMNGDKEVRVSYENAEAVDYVTFVSSPAFAYVWRVLVYLLVVYLLAWVVGFFFGLSKNLPQGMFVEIKPKKKPDNPANMEIYPINLTFMNRWGWHLRRFFCPFLWGHQPGIKAGDLELKFTKDGRPVFVFSSECYSMQMRKKPALKVLNNYTNDCRRSYRTSHSINITEPSIKSADVLSIFAPKLKDKIEEGKEVKAGDTAYGFLDKKGNVTKIIFFVKF